MNCWFLLPITLSAVTFIGSWAIYGLALFHNHVCSLSNWDYRNSCDFNRSESCCEVPTISTSGKKAPESSLFTATANAGALLFLAFCVCHHAHIMGQSRGHALLSKAALVFGCVASAGTFMAGNCNPEYLMVLHYLAAATTFVCLCFYSLFQTILTHKCGLTGMEWLLFPTRIALTAIQISATICYFIFCTRYGDYFLSQLSAVFEWAIIVNTQLFQLSFAVEFRRFSSYMLSELLGKKDEEKFLILS